MAQISATDALRISIALDLGLDLSATGPDDVAAIKSAARVWARDKLADMTLDEKVSLLAGGNQWQTTAVRRLGVSKLKTSDGPVGVRGALFTDGVSAASLPTSVSLAATWDNHAIEDICEVLISEARSKEVDILLGPAVCIPRTPLGGRNFETFSEDPFLNGKLSGVYINNIQGAGIATCIKHFVANDQEDRRYNIDEKIPPRALREIHMQPFQIALRDSDPWSLMSAYNRVNGDYCSANKFLLQDVLRDEWGYDGVVISDWFGTNSVVPSLKAGVDLEMPGPTRRRGKHILDALEKGLIDSSFVDDSARRMLELVYKTGKSQYPDWEESGEVAIDLPEHRVLLRRAGAEGIVLLKNTNNVLPLENLDGKTIAVIGPNALRSVATGGGSSNLDAPHYRTIPYQSIKNEVAKTFPSATVRAHAGISMHKYLPLMNSSVMKNPRTGDPGFTVTFWGDLTHSGTPASLLNQKTTNFSWPDGLPAALSDGRRYSYRARSIMTPQTSGLHQFGISACGPAKLMLDGKLILDIDRHWWSPRAGLFMGYASAEERVSVQMEAGREYEVVLDVISRENSPSDFDFMAMLEREDPSDGVRLGFLEDEGDTDKTMQEAVDLARSSDIAVLVVGKDHEWEAEAIDMVSMDLPGRSNELIAAVAKANPNTIVVNQTGSPITMPWEAEVPAIVQAWYQGQEQGNCIADILLGNVNPCGRLPITFPRRLEDNPSYDNYPGEYDIVHYGENIYAGYRFYDHRKIEPLFPFGAGLSYTTFEYSNIKLSRDVISVNGTITVEVDISNTGSRDGKEVVQFYVSQASPRLQRPPQELKGYDKVFVRAGQTVTARTTLDKVSVSYWDEGMRSWVIDGGAKFTVRAAKHSRDEGVAAVFHSCAQGGAWIN